jgi:predicted site-specific integrase-resolvase
MIRWVRLVLAHKDELLRFGAELVFAICEAKNVEVVILNQGEDTTFEQDLLRGGLGQRRFGDYHGVQRPAGW